MAFTVTEPAVQSYLLYSSILALKMIAVGVLTSVTRKAKKVYANPEDAKMGQGIVKLDDPDVERTRRAHLNDLENIPMFWILGAMYLTTGPAAAWATILFRIFTAFRVVHTLVYAVIPLPQPARGISFGIPALINVYMAVQVMFYYMSAL